MSSNIDDLMKQITDVKLNDDTDDDEVYDFDKILSRHNKPSILIQDVSQERFDFLEYLPLDMLKSFTFEEYLFDNEDEPYDTIQDVPFTLESNRTTFGTKNDVCTVIFKMIYFHQDSLLVELYQVEDYVADELQVNNVSDIYPFITERCHNCTFFAVSYLDENDFPGTITKCIYVREKSTTFFMYEFEDNVISESITSCNADFHDDLEYGDDYHHLVQFPKFMYHNESRYFRFIIKVKNWVLLSSHSAFCKVLIN